MQSSVLNNLLKQNFSGLPVKNFLQQVAAEHPYFTPVQFFLLQQLSESDSSFSQQAVKTALLFNNPHWLHFQLQQNAVKEAPVVTMFAAKEAEPVTALPPVSEQETVQMAAAEMPAENSDNDDDNAVLNNSNNFEEISNTAAQEETVTAHSDNTDNDDDNSVLITKENIPAEAPSFKIDFGAVIKNAENTNAPAFEPMHLVDYFASQGIKLSEEVQSADKLGKQLKSFTEWLKTMKKVHVADTGAASGGEIAIQAMAEKSNTENEVVTEAMAEVFAQQGKTAKAIEVYEKLSLLNTGKSAYFAAKIQNLKGE